MTTMTTVLGLLPMALGFGDAAELRTPMADGDWWSVGINALNAGADSRCLQTDGSKSMNLASAAVKRPVSVAMLFLGLALMGVFAGLRLPLEQFPEMEIPFVGISITYPNATPEEVEENLARPIEEVLLLLEGIDEIRSNSSQNHLWISLMLDSSDEIAGKGNEAKELIDNVRHRLPESVRYIDLYQRDPNDSPILSMMITAPMLDEQDAYTLLDQGLKMRLERLNGVNSVEVFGIQQNYLEIALDPARLESLGVQVVDVRRRLQSENFVLSGGEVDGELQTVRVRPMGQFASLEDIEQLRFANGTIRLKILGRPLRAGRLDGSSASERRSIARAIGVQKA